MILKVCDTDVFVQYDPFQRPAFRPVAGLPEPCSQSMRSGCLMAGGLPSHRAAQAYVICVR
jgi:hypothetical protein